MTQWHRKSNRTSTGGKRHSDKRRDKRLTEKGGNPSMTQVDENTDKRVSIKGRGHTSKVQQRLAKYANVTDSKTKKTHKLEIVRVLKNTANRQYARTNIITKGAEIEIKDKSGVKTAVVTSKPGQSGIVSAVFK